MKQTNIAVSKLRPFENNPFQVRDDAEMNTLIESIQAQGILSPLIVRPIENTEEYEVVSGHRRLHAAQKAGFTEVPALIYALDRDAAAIAVVDSNLHREHILPSEKAFAYKMKMEALSHQGKRTDLTSDQVAPKLSTEVIGEQEGISKDTVKRYIRLTHLIPEFLEKMDQGEIALSVGVELSFLDESSQREVLEQCAINDCTPVLFAGLADAQGRPGGNADQGSHSNHYVRGKSQSAGNGESPHLPSAGGSSARAGCEKDGRFYHKCLRLLSQISHPPAQSG